jgi:6-phospho-beta-glucosidase
MKIVIVGAGSYRVLGIMRSTLAIPGVLDGGEINLYDLNATRSGAMGKMIMKSPELKRAGCRVTWGTSLEEALDGADAVGVILVANSSKRYMLGEEASLRHGFISSDNVSPNGAFAGLNIAPVLLDLARKMEKHCPNAWLLNFVNPIAVLSTMINNHTKIKALGLCGGFTNHLSDISRIFGTDEEAKDLHVETAGINHLSFIRSGTYKGRDLFEQLDRRVASDWKMCKLQDWWSEGAKKGITNSVTQLVRFYRELGVLVFSSEGDGMDHLKYDEAVAWQRQTVPKRSAEGIEVQIKKDIDARAQDDLSFQEYLSQDLDRNFWENHWKKDPRFKRVDEDVFVRVFGALAGVKETRVAASRPNRGSIPGLKDRYAIEATYSLFKNDLKQATPHEVPDIVQGLIAGIASHHTMLGDAIVAQDPKLLAHALLAYPMRPYSKEATQLYKALITINSEGLSPTLRRASEYLDF